MIFKTIQTDLDGVINKLGIFNKSFADIFNAYRTNGVLGVKNSLSFGITKTDISNIEKYNALRKSGVSTQTAWYKTMQSSSKAAQELVIAEKGAIVSTETLSNAQKTMSVSAKAGQIALSGLAMAGNMIAFMAIARGIEEFIGWLDRLVNTEKYAQEAFENAISTVEKYKNAISDTQSEIKNTKETVNDIASTYAKLSQGVDVSTNKNISLTNKEYENFLDLNNQLAELFPSLTKNYDENGNAILNLGGSVESITSKISALVQQQERLSKIEMGRSLEAYVDGEGENGGQLAVIERLEDNLTKAEDVLADFNQKYNAILNGEQVQEDLLNSKQVESAKKYYKEAFGLTEEELQDAIIIDQNILGEGVYRFDFGNLEIDEVRKNKILASYNSFYKELNNELIYAQSELKAANQEMSSMIMMWVEDEFAYKEGGKTFQTLIQNMVNSIDWNALDISDFAEAKTWIRDNIFTLVNSVEGDDRIELTNALNELFTLDTSKISVETREQIKKYISTISKILGEDAANKLKINLGFDEYDTEVNSLVSAINEAKKQENDFDWEAWFDKNSIDTQEEIDRWNEIKEAANNAAKARKNYTNGDTKTPWSSKFDTLWNSEEFTDAKESLQDLAKEAGITEDDINSLAKENEELATLLDESGMSSQFAAACFEKMCNGTGDFSSITDSALELDKALHGAESALLDAANAKTKYDEAMSKDDYNTEFLNYQEAYATAMEAFKNGEYGKNFRASMEYLLGEDSYSMSIEELYKSTKKLKSVFGEDANNGLEFLDKLYEKKEILDDLDSSLEKTADGGYKFDLKAEEFDEIAKALGMTTEEVAACDRALGMFGDYTSYEIDDVKKALEGMAISVSKTGKSTVSLQGLQNTLSDLGYEGYEAYQILEKLRSQDDVKLLNFDASNSEQVTKLINKLKELDAIHIDPSGAIDTSSLVQKMSDFGMTSDQIATFLNQVNQLTNYHFNGSNFEDLKSVKTYVDEVLGNDDKSSIESMDTLKESEDNAKTSAENLQEAIEGVDTASVSTVTDGVSDLSDELNTANNKAITLKKNLDKLDLNNSGFSGNSGGKGSGSSTKEAEVTGTFAYANGSKVTLDKDQEALVNELGEESIVRDGELHVIPGGAHIEKLKKGDIIFNHKQTEELKKHGRVITNSGRGKIVGAFKSGTVPAFGSGSIPGKNPATNKDWSDPSKKEEKKKKSSSKDTDTTKFQEAIDWCTETINKLTGIIDNINAKLNSTTASLKSQIANYKKLLSQQQALINGYEKTKKVRTSEYKKSLSKLSKEDRKKVEDGTYTIEQFTGKAKSGKTSKEEKRHNNIQDAIEARDAMISADADLINAKQEFQEYAEAMAAIRWEKATEKVEKLNGELDLLELKETNANGYKAKNALVDEQLATQKKNVKIQRKAVAQTDKDADKYYKKISKENRKNVNADGTIKTKGITDKKELKNIKIYNAYVKQSAQNTLELAKAEEELKASKKEAILTKAQNIQDEYDMKVGEYEARINRIQDKVSLVEAQGNIVGKTYYTSMIASTKTSLALKEDELELLQTQLENAKHGTEEWYELSQKVSDCASETDNLKISTEELNTAMQELDTSAFDNLLAKFQKVNDEADFYIKLMESSGDLFDEDGNMTELGTAKLGLLYGKYNTSQNEGEEAGKKAERYSSFLTEAEKNGKVTIDDTTYSLKQLKEKIASLKEAQQDAILSTIDYRDEIYDFIEEGINAEIKAYEELIEKKKEALVVNEELYEFQKKMTESSKDIALIQRQLAALEGDNSDEARKKRRELEVQLSDAEESHQELVKEQSITMQSEALDEALENFKADMEKRLEELKENKDLTEVSKTVNANLPGISETLNKILTKVGYNEDDDTKKIFNSGNGGTVESNVDNVTNNYITEAEKEKKEADEKAKSDVSNVTNETSTVGLEEVIDKEQESQQIAEQQKEEAQKVLASQIESIIKSGTFRDLVDVDSKDKKGNYKYNKVNRYLIKQHGYSINDKKQVRIAKLLGMSGATENNIGNDAKQTKLLKKLKNAGFSTGGMVKVDDLNSIVKANGDDGIATVKKDEYVLTPVQTQSFIDLAKLSPDLLQASNTLIDGLKFNPTIPLASGTQLQNIDASVNIQVQGNADATTVKDIRKIAEDVVAKQQKEIQRQAYNRGMRLR